MRKALLAAAVLLTACVGCETADVNYMGKTYAPTKSIEVFYNKADIPAKYTVMGRAIVTAPEDMSGKQIQDKIIKEAEAKGAEAIFIGETREVKSGAVTTGGWGINHYDPFLDGGLWEFGPTPGEDDFAMAGPLCDFGPAETVYNYSLKIQVLFLKSK